MNEQKSGAQLYADWKREKQNDAGFAKLDRAIFAVSAEEYAKNDPLLAQILADKDAKVEFLRDMLAEATNRSEEFEADEQYPDDLPDDAADEKPSSVNVTRGNGTPQILLIPRFNGPKLEYGRNTLPPDCPVRALGKNGEFNYFLNTLGEIRPISENGFGQGAVANLFGDKLDYLYEKWPQLEKLSREEMAAQKIPKVKGFHVQYARDALMVECGRKGIFEVRDKVRGRGCWKNEDNELIVHLGDRVIINSHKKPKTIIPGEIDGKVYPARPRVPEPINDAALGARKLREMYERICARPWERGEKDARLLMGWMGASILNGALDWRPMVFVLGDAASGKSTLQKEIRLILDQRVISTVDASPAALRGMMKNDAISVSFDEIEADAKNNDKAIEVMKLARYAASGDTLQRSSQNQELHEFTLMGSMLFSAINPPPMRAQDKQRFCFLKANPFTENSIYRQLKPREYREIGQYIAGRMIYGWSRFDDTLTAYREILMADYGHSDRGGLQFGTLLSAFDLLFNDELDPNHVAQICAEYPKPNLAEYEDVEQNFTKYWRVLLNAQPQIWRPNNETVGEIVAKLIRAQKSDLLHHDDKDKEAGKGDDVEKYHIMLERVGLGVVRDKKTGRFWLAIPNDHPLTQKLFRESDLQGGNWKEALRHGKKYDPIENEKGIWRTQGHSFSGTQSQSTLICLEAEHDFGNGDVRPLFTWKHARTEVKNGD